MELIFLVVGVPLGVAAVLLLVPGANILKTQSQDSTDLYCGSVWYRISARVVAVAASGVIVAFGFLKGVLWGIGLALIVAPALGARLYQLDQALKKRVRNTS